jgi:hypothetical protein
MPEMKPNYRSQSVQKVTQERSSPQKVVDICRRDPKESSTHTPRCAIFYGVGLGFPDQRLQPRLQILGRDFVEAVIDLAGID